MRYIQSVATLSLDQSKCTGCGRCAEVCPHRVFALHETTETTSLTAAPLTDSENKKPKLSGAKLSFSKPRKAAITDIDRCMECGACAKNCPVGALSVHAGVGCAYALIKAKITGKKAACCC